MYKRKTVDKWKFDAIKLTALTLFLAVFLALVKQSYKPAQPLSPEATGEVTVYKVVETKVEKINVAEIVDKIHTLESSKGQAKQGLHIFCREKGQSNEYGYGGMQKMLCFRNHTEATAIIHLWFNNRLGRMSVSEAVCLYNTGRTFDDCPYYQKFLEVK